MRMWVLSLLLTIAPSCYGEATCFRTVAAAIARVGTASPDGFYVEAVRQDAFSGATWATVRNCAHPEWPAISVRSSRRVRVEVSATGRQVEARPLMLAGARVRVVMLEEQLRLEVVGVAQSSGRLGERVRVRILQLDSQSEERFAMGLVRSADLVEMER